MRIKIMHYCLFNYLLSSFSYSIAFNLYIFFIVVNRVRIDVAKRKRVKVKRKSAKLFKTS